MWKGLAAALAIGSLATASVASAAAPAQSLSLVSQGDRAGASAEDGSSLGGGSFLGIAIFVALVGAFWLFAEASSDDDPASP